MQKSLNILAVVMVGTVVWWWGLQSCTEEPAPVEEDSYICHVAVDLEGLLDAIQAVENPCKDPELVGDQHLKHKAYGIYQIRQPFLDDVNRIAGEEVLQELWGCNKLTIQDVKDAEIARWCAKVYLIHYGIVYANKTDNAPTLATYAKIYNGGPNGWMKESTNTYVARVLEQSN